MQSNVLASVRPGIRALLCAFALVLTGCGTVVQPWGPTTTVAPLVSEDLAAPCKYQMHLASNPAPNGVVPAPLQQRGVVVIFERADSVDLYDDPAVQAMAHNLQFATMFAYQCDAASFDDLQFDATKGPGRTLFQALNQFAEITGHTELANANVILTGFSAGAYLSMTITNAYPQRVLGTVLDAPADSHANLQYLAVSPLAAQVPTLILANSGDISAGTHRPLAFFQQAWSQGARWGFGVKNGLGHCCTDEIAPLMDQWVTSVVQSQSTVTAAGLVSLEPASAPPAPAIQFACVPNATFDVFGWQNCDISDPSVVSSEAITLQPGWMPDATSAQAWLKWVAN